MSKIDFYSYLLEKKGEENTNEEQNTEEKTKKEKNFVPIDKIEVFKPMFQSLDEAISAIDKIINKSGEDAEETRQKILDFISNSDPKFYKSNSTFAVPNYKFYVIDKDETPFTKAKSSSNDASNDNAKSKKAPKEKRYSGKITVVKEGKPVVCDYPEDGAIEEIENSKFNHLDSLYPGVSNYLYRRKLKDVSSKNTAIKYVQNVLHIIRNVPIDKYYNTGEPNGHEPETVHGEIVAGDEVTPINIVNERDSETKEKRSFVTPQGKDTPKIECTVENAGLTIKVNGGNFVDSDDYQGLADFITAEDGSTYLEYRDRNKDKLNSKLDGFNIDNLFKFKATIERFDDSKFNKALITLGFGNEETETYVCDLEGRSQIIVLNLIDAKGNDCTFDYTNSPSDGVLTIDGKSQKASASFSGRDTVTIETGAGESEYKIESRDTKNLLHLVNPSGDAYDFRYKNTEGGRTGFIVGETYSDGALMPAKVFINDDRKGVCAIKMKPTTSVDTKERYLIGNVVARNAMRIKLKGDDEEIKKLDPSLSANGSYELRVKGNSAKGENVAGAPTAENDNAFMTMAIADAHGADVKFNMIVFEASDYRVSQFDMSSPKNSNAVGLTSKPGTVMKVSDKDIYDAFTKIDALTEENKSDAELKKEIRYLVSKTYSSLDSVLNSAEKVLEALAQLSEKSKYYISIVSTARGKGASGILTSILGNERFVNFGIKGIDETGELEYNDVAFEEKKMRKYKTFVPMMVSYMFGTITESYMSTLSELLQKGDSKGFNNMFQKYIGQLTKFYKNIGGADGSNDINEVGSVTGSNVIGELNTFYQKSGDAVSSPRTYYVPALITSSGKIFNQFNDRDCLYYDGSKEYEAEKRESIANFDGYLNYAKNKLKDVLKDKEE